MAQWQWIDGQGRKVFSDRAPPAEIPAKNILRSPGMQRPAGGTEAAEAPAAVPATAAASTASSGTSTAMVRMAYHKCPQCAVEFLEEQKRKQQEQEAAKQQADKLKQEKVRQENCARAKQAKETLSSGRMLSHVNAKGERGFMDEAARDAEIKRADAVIASECGPMQDSAQ